MFYLLAQAEPSIKDSLKGITDPVTNIGALAILGVFLLRVVPVLVQAVVKALSERDDKFARVIDTIQVKQDERNAVLAAGIKEQTTALTNSFEKGFSEIKTGLLSACKSGR